MKKTKWKILLFVGTTPFLWAFFSGLYAALTGFSGLSLSSPQAYGFAAFADWIILYSFVYWPTYVIGLILIVWAAMKLISGGKDQDAAS